MLVLGLDKLQPGMRLAEPSYNFQGVLLLDAGVELSENNIRILKSWGVAKVSIDGKSEDKKAKSVDSENKIRSSIRNGLQKKFSDVLDDPVMEEIMRVAGKILQKRSLSGEGHEKS
ncbi:conserved hypothetical protein [uncultured Desulfobacterium sp.]|uniref:Uncharacterized protein n=1 Tax=uncultured Desulfobacterium sp. TaxID=201089 RepID=A0A445MUQ2_9BACT|nr:conserved hypothetical protein [uncultured Desulfobacterium sp.]